MTLDEFENALHKLLDDAVKGGLDADVVQEVAEAIVNNTYLDDDCEDAVRPAIS
jgi:hypothetical protein